MGGGGGGGGGLTMNDGIQVPGVVTENADTPHVIHMWLTGESAPKSHTCCDYYS